MAEFREYLVMLNSDPSDSKALAELQKLGPSVLASDEAASALDEARQQLLGKGASEAVVGLFDVELAHVQPERQAQLLLGKGQVVFEDLLNPNTGIECIGEALRLQPDNSQAKELLEHLELVKAHWEQIVDKYIEEAEATTESSLATTLYRAAAEMYARYQTGAAEIEQYLRKALEVDPKNQRASRQLGRLLAQNEKWDELKEHLRSSIETADKNETKIALWIRLAELAKGPLADPELAVSAMKEVIAVNPAHPRALARLADHYQESENWAAAVTLYGNALKMRRRSGNPETEIDMLIQIGMLHWKRLEDAEAAEEYFARLRKLEPAHPVMLNFYKSYYVESDQAGKLMQLYRQALKSVGHSDPERKRALTVELANLSESSMDNPEKAIDSWKSILRSDPANTEAIESLRRLYERTGKWNALLDLIKDDVERLPSEDVKGRIAGLLEVVEIYRDQLKLDVMVINTYNSILVLDPSNIEVLDALALKYKELGRWNDLITVLSRKSQLDGVDPAERESLLSQIAALWVDRFGNYAQAIKPLEELLEANPSNTEAITRLKEIYTRRRQWRALIALLGREAEIMELPARRQHYAEMAQLAGQKLGDARLAINIWNRVLELPGSEADPDSTSADTPAVYDALCNLYEREKRYPALAEMLRRKRDLAVTTEAALPVLERLGVLYADRIKAPSQAAEVYKEILELKPEHAKAARVLRELYASARDYDALEALYGSLGHWEDLVEAYFTIADKIDDRDETIALLERSARVAQEHVDNPDKVARVYERLQGIEPNHLGAARALAPLYRASGKWARLLSIHEILLANADEGDKLPLIDDIRKLCEEQLGSKSMAFQWTAKAFELRPEDPDLLEELKRLAADSDAWQEVSEILDKRVDSATTSDSDRLQLLRDLGRIAEQKLHEPDRARSYFQRILEIEPEDRQALDSLEELATHQNEWPALLEILRKRVNLESDDETRADLLFKVAHIEEERQQDPQAAAKSYERILGIDSQNRRAMRALGRIYETQDNWNGLAEVLEREQATLSDPDAEAALLMRLATLYQTQLERPDDARETYKKVMELAPSRQVHEALEQYLTPSNAGEVRHEIAELLLPVFEDANDQRKIAVALEILRSDAEGDDKLAFEKRLAGLYLGDLGDLERAYEVSGEILLADPADGDNRERLGRLGKELTRAEDLKAKLEAGLQASEEQGCDPTVVLAIALELAHLCDEVLEDLDAAHAAWVRVRELDEHNEEAFAALSRIYRFSERYQELRTLIEEQVERSLDADERVRMFWQLAELCVGALGDSSGAKLAFLGIIEANPEQGRAFDALISIYEREQAWQDLEELLARRADYLGEEALEASETRRAQLRAGLLKDSHGAVDLAEELLSRNPDNRDARSVCEQFLEDSELSLRVARILEPLYLGEERWAALCEVLRVQSRGAELVHESFELLARIAEIQETNMGQGEAALATWQEALATEPAEERALEAVLRLAPVGGDWSSVATAIEAAVEKVDLSDISTKARLLRAAAEIAQTQLDDRARAKSLLEALLDLESSDPEVIRYTTSALDILYGGDEDHAKQVVVLRKAAEWAESNDERKGLLSRVAEIEEVFLENAEAARQTWDAVLGEDPEDAVALASLERLYADSEQYRDMSEIMRRRIDLHEDSQQKAEGLERLATVFDEKLGDIHDAITCLLEVLDLEIDTGPVQVRLCELYRRERRFDDLLDILERRINEAEGAERARLVFEAGVVLADELGRGSEALEHYADVLRLDVDHSEAKERILRCVQDPDLRMRAAEILDPLYEASADWPALISLLETLIAEGDDPRMAVSQLRRVAKLQEESLDKPEEAFKYAERAVRAGLSEPELPELLSELQRLAAECGCLDRLVQVYRDVAPDVFDGELQRRLYLDIADLSRAVLQDDATAREYYQKVVDAQPDDPRALGALEGLCRDAEDYPALYDIVVQKAEMAGDDIDARARSLAEAGDLCSTHLNRAEDAAMHWEQVLELTPDSREVAAKLQHLYRKGERWHDLAEALESRLGFAMSVQEAVELRFQLGELYEHKLHDPDAAVDNYGAAIGGDPNHERAMAALERLLDDPGTRAAVADIIEPVHVAHQNWPQLVRIYEIKLEAADDPSERLRITKYIARLHEDQLEDLDGAFHWLGRVFREAPSDRNVRMQLERLASVLQSWERLSEVYQEFLDDESGDTPEVREVAETLADIYDKRLDQVEKALDAYKRVLQMEPENETIFKRTENMLLRAERWLSLVGLYEEVVHSSFDDGRRQSLYSKLAKVQETRLDDNSKAIDALRAILEINPENDDAISELDRLLQAQNSWVELSELLLSQIDRAASEEQILESRLRLAQLRERRLDDVDGAIDEYEQALAMPNGDLALTALERLVVDENYQERIANILEPVYRERDWWQKLVVILDAQLRSIDDPGQRGDMLREIAQIHEERGGDLNLAMRALGKAWLEDVTDVPLYERFVELGIKLGHSQVLVDTLEAGIDDHFDYDLVAKVLLQLARIKEEQEKDPKGAIAYLKRLLEQSDDNLEGLFEIDRLYVEQASWDKLVPILERRAELEGEPDLRIGHMLRLARIHEEERKDSRAAIDTYRNVLAVEDGHADALDALDRLYRAEGNYSELAQTLLAKVDHETEALGLRDLHFELSRIYETELKDSYEAIAQLRAVVDLDPDDRQALAELRRLYESESMWNEMLEILDQQILLSEGDEKVETTFAAAFLIEEKLMDIDGALDRYAAVLTLDSGHKGAREALERHSKGLDAGERACDILEGVYRAEGNHDALAQVFETRLTAHEGDVGIRAGLFSTLAEIHELSRGDLESAFSTWSRALVDHPEDEAVQGQLERIAHTLGNWPKLVELYEAGQNDATDPTIEFQFANKLGAIYEENLGKLDKAAEAYERALGVASEEPPTLVALSRIYQASNKPKDFAHTLSRQADATLDEGEQAGFLFELGQVREERLGEVAEAIDSYRDVLERDPQHSAARGALERLLTTKDEERANIIAILEPLYEQDGDSARLADLLATKIQICDDNFERAQMWTRLAEIAEQELGDLTRALDAVGSWLAEDPQSDEALGELVRLGETLDRPGEVAARLDGIAGVVDVTDVKQRLHQESARLKLDKLSDSAGALQNIEALLKIEPDDLTALESLQRVCREQGDVERLAKTQWRRAELTFEPADKREFMAEAARLRLQLGRPDDAIEAWREVLAQDEADREAQDELAALFRSNEKWNDLVEVLGVASRYSVDGERDRVVRTEIALVQADKLNDLDAAVDAWQAVLDLDPVHPEPLAALESLHRRREDFMAVQEILLRKVDAVESDAERIGVYLRLAQVAQIDREAPEEAIDFLQSVVDIDGYHEQANDQMERILRGLERWHDVVDLYQRRAEAAAVGGNIQAELGYLAQAAEIWESQLENPDEAAEILERILARDPNSVAALTRLAKIYEKNSEWDRCQEILQQALSLGPQGRDAADLYVRLGEVARNKDSDEAAAQQYFAQALGFDGYHPGAIARVEEGARAGENWPVVADMVRRRYESSRDTKEKLDLTVELASLYGERLGKAQEVIPLLEQARQEAPGDPRILGPLADLYFHAGRHGEAAPMYETLAAEAKKKRRMKDVAGYKARLAGILDAQGDSVGAIKAYEEAFRVDPTNVRTMSGLGQLYMAAQDWDKARRVYRSMVLQNIDPAIGITKADVYFQLGQIHQALGEVPKAKDMYKRAVGTDKGHEAAKAALDAL